jgi:hypothetical protein
MILMIPFLFLIMGMGACEDNEPQYEIYENHDISACGVKDPLRNLEWLKNNYENSKLSFLMKVYLLEDTISGENYFDFVYRTKDIEWSLSNVKNCNGEIVFAWQYSTPPSPEHAAFYADKVHIALLWSVKEIE